MTDELAAAVAAFHEALDADPDSEVFHCPPANCSCGTTEGNTTAIVEALLASGWTPPPTGGRVELLPNTPMRFTERTPTTFIPGWPGSEDG